MYQKVLVTGSSGGLGSQIVKTLTGMGFAVIGLDRAKPAEEPEGLEFFECDLRSEESISKVLSKRNTRGIGAIIHCAAEQPQVGAGAGGSRESWLDAYRVNVLSLERLTSQLAEEIEGNEPKRIIAIGSVHEKATSTNMAPYSVSKAALAAWVRAAAIDLQAKDISVIGLSVGAMDGPKLQQGLQRFANPDEKFASLVSRLPAGRVVSPKDVADLCVKLFDPSMRHFTGSNLTFEGGATALLSTE